MPIAAPQKYRLIAAVVLIAATAAVSVRLIASGSASADDAVPSSVLVGDADGFRYEYHIPTGREGLYDADADPRRLVNVLPRHTETAAKCRRALEEKLQVPSLESLRARYADEIRRLHALGYL